MISIIDYGMGNLKSVKKALKYIGVDAKITANEYDIENSKGIILPGVGAFPEAMKNLKNKKLDVVIKDTAAKGIPLIGICLGMQLLFDTGEEIEKCSGLGLIPGNITKLYGDIKIPHIGWNSLTVKKECSILEGIPQNSYVYFVHSFYAELECEENLNAYSFYGVDVPAVVNKGNVYGTQFHPEKSGDVGIKMLKNFIKLIEK
ncbi:imidazole glycerol phosphate synthase subunit HisH [Clostridium sp. WILCCON 0269]|uniref:Imidazole glycerol phosphate synthase subunit HisH n=1 Tax=Candidatus Clostridium eludens TaxID=3381663 RepID=A0ABW8SLH7_9CLOT